MGETVSVEVGQGKQAMRRLAQSFPGMRCLRPEVMLLEGSSDSKVNDRNKVQRK